MLIRRLLIALFLLFPAKGFSADSTVSALGAASALAGSELFYCVQSSADKKCTASQLSTFVLTAPKPTVCAGFPGAVCPTTGTNATYTTPAGALWIEFVAQGPGSGGGGGGTGGGTGATSTSDTCIKTSATACTTPDVLRATAAVGSQVGSAGVPAGAPGACTVGGNVQASTGNPGAQGAISVTGSNGAPGNGGASPFGGAGIANPNGAAGAAVANSGSGGSGGDATVAGLFGGTGGSSGGYCRQIVVAPGATYIYTIGPSAAGGTAGTSGVAGAAGAAGGIQSIEHYGN